MNCNYCEFRCELENRTGICGRYIQKDGGIRELEPMMLLRPYYFQMEEMPFFHGKPGAVVAQTGTKSCNAACEYCLNSHVAIGETDVPLQPYTAKELISQALEHEAEGIIFGINEVTCFMQSAIEISDRAHEAGLFTGCMTNGFETESAAQLLAEKMDFINLSLKAIDDDMYREMLHLPSVAPILRNARIFAAKSHLEIVTPLVPELNKGKLLQIAEFIGSIDPNIPWHLFRLQPANHRVETGQFNMAQTMAVLEEGKKYLHYIYLGNLAGSRWVNTLCPKCGKTLVKRVCIGSCGSKFVSAEYEGTRCPDCGEPIPIVR